MVLGHNTVLPREGAERVRLVINLCNIPCVTGRAGMI